MYNFNVHQYTHVHTTHVHTTHVRVQDSLQHTFPMCSLN